jgi:hypothetical protein
MVYPDGLNKHATEDELNISFQPSPNYAALAEAAAGKEWMQSLRVSKVGDLREALQRAVTRVGKEKMGMLIEILM